MNDWNPPYEPTDFESPWHHAHMCAAAFAAALPEERTAEDKARERRQVEADAFKERVRLWADTAEADPLIDAAYAEHTASRYQKTNR